MKKFTTLVLIVSFLSVASVASAASFTTPKTWDPYYEINGSYTYTQNLDLPTPALTLNSASLSITHKGNSNWEFYGWGEIWYARGEDNLFIGKLGDSEYSQRTDTFTLDSSVLSEIMDNSPWSLYVKLYDTVGGNDHLKVYASVISGDYTPASEPVPEPATMILLGSALAGLAAKRKFRK